MTRRPPVVAIDGPAGAGKTTVSRRVALELAYTLVDTGALYRSVALAARERGVDWDDAEAVAAVARELADADAIGFGTEAGEQRVSLGERDVTEAIRTAEIGLGASRVAGNPGVRAALLDIQRASASSGAVVLEGRDIGTVVCPDAEAKFFLTASTSERAKRRWSELQQRGEQLDLASVEQQVRERDERDERREVAPLKRAADAELVDSSHLSIDEVVAHIVDRVRALESAP